MSFELIDKKLNDKNDLSNKKIESIDHKINNNNKSKSPSEWIATRLSHLGSGIGLSDPTRGNDTFINVKGNVFLRLPIRYVRGINNNITASRLDGWFGNNPRSIGITVRYILTPSDINTVDLFTRNIKLWFRTNNKWVGLNRRNFLVYNNKPYTFPTYRKISDFNLNYYITKKSIGYYVSGSTNNYIFNGAVRPTPVPTSVNPDILLNIINEDKLSIIHNGNIITNNIVRDHTDVKLTAVNNNNRTNNIGLDGISFWINRVNPDSANYLYLAASSEEHANGIVYPYRFVNRLGPNPQALFYVLYVRVAGYFIPWVFKD